MCMHLACVKFAALGEHGCYAHSLMCKGSHPLSRGWTPVTTPLPRTV